MKNLTFFNSTCLLAICGLLLGTLSVRADEGGEQKKETPSEASASQDAVRVVLSGGAAEADLAAEIERILKAAGLTGKELQRTVEKVGKAVREAGASDGGANDGGANDGGAIRGLRRKAVVIGPDGKRREINLTWRARNENPPEILKGVWNRVEQALKEAGVDKDQIEKIRKSWTRSAEGSALRRPWTVEGYLIGPDGKLKKFDTEPKNLWSLELGDGFMIGLNCIPASESLRAQLGLPDDVGLVVESVADETPAQKAGVAKHDVLTRAGNQKLSKVEQLVAAVQEAGKAETTLELTLMRRGEEKKIRVKPEERKAVGIDDRWPRFIDPLTGLPGSGNLGPGVIRWDLNRQAEGEMKSLKQQIDELKKQVQELRKAVEASKSSSDE